MSAVVNIRHKRDMEQYREAHAATAAQLRPIAEAFAGHKGTPRRLDGALVFFRQHAPERELAAMKKLGDDVLRLDAAQNECARLARLEGKGVHATLAWHALSGMQGAYCAFMRLATSLYSFESGSWATIERIDADMQKVSADIAEAQEEVDIARALLESRVVHAVEVTQ